MRSPTTIGRAMCHADWSNFLARVRDYLRCAVAEIRGAARSALRISAGTLERNAFSRIEITRRGSISPIRGGLVAISRRQC